MFSVHFTVGELDYTIDNDLPNELDTKLISPQVEMESNAFGSFTFTVPPGHKYYDVIRGAYENAEISIYRRPGLKRIFLGRLLDCKRDTMKNLQMVFEGELSYLQDTIQEPHEYKEYTPYQYLSALLAVHNKKVPVQKQFQIGNVTVTDDDSTDYITGKVNRGSYSTSYSHTTWSCISSLISNLGGHLEVRWENGVRYLDYLKDYTTATTQAIEFGENLIEYAEEWSLADLYTVIVPIGASVSNTDESGKTESKNIDISSANGGSVYLFANSEVLNKYGRREKMVNFSGITSPAKLKAIGQLYLQNTQFDNMVLSLTAVDLKVLGYSGVNDYLEFQSLVTASAAPYGMVNRQFPVSKVSIPLKDPGKAVYTMSTNTRLIKNISTTISDQIQDTDDKFSDLEDKIDDTVDEIKGTELGGEAEDWIFGVAEIIYPKDEQIYEFLYHPTYLYLVYDPEVTGAIVNALVNISGVDVPKPSTWYNAMAKDGLPSGTFTCTDWELHADDESDVTNAGDGWLSVDPYLGCKMPIDTRSSVYSAWVLYLVIQFPEGVTDSGTGDISCDTIFGFQNFNGGYYLGVTNATSGSGGQLATVSGSTKTAINFNRPGATVAGPILALNKKLVIAMCSGVIDGLDHTASPLLVATAANGVCTVADNVPGFYSESDYGLGFKYENGTMVDTNTAHGFNIKRVALCRAVRGQINADEVYDNVRWLLECYINGTMKEGDLLPDESSGGE